MNAYIQFHQQIAFPSVILIDCEMFAFIIWMCWKLHLGEVGFQLLNVIFDGLDFFMQSTGIFEDELDILIKLLGVYGAEDMLDVLGEFSKIAGSGERVISV